MYNDSTICDKCGKEIVNPYGCYRRNYKIGNYSAKIHLWGVGIDRSQNPQRIDLCEECYQKFINWLEVETQ